MKYVLVLFFLCIVIPIHAQHNNAVIATLDADNRTLTIEQTLELINNSGDPWDHVILLDWAHAFSDTDTPLANRFAEDFKNRFQFANDKDRGMTIFNSETSSAHNLSRLPDHPDVIRLDLETPLASGESKTVSLNYTIKIPEDDFTGYGRTSTNDYNLKYWYISPAVYKNGSWEYYSHKGINDYYPALMDHSISLHLPSSHKVITNASIKTQANQQKKNSYLLKEEHAGLIELHLKQDASTFKNYGVPDLNVQTDINDDDVPIELKALFIDRISSYLKERLGDYSSDEMLLTERYYKEDPVYGLSSLPDFINPFPAGFTWELKLLKSMTRKWIKAGARLNPRDEAWLQNGMMVYLIYNYQKQYYPDLKIAGKLSNFWGIRGFNLTQVDFTDQYRVLYENTARLNLDEAITTPADSLVKYNQQLGIVNKTAVGLDYLNEYSGNNTVDLAMEQFYQKYHLTETNADALRSIIDSLSPKNTDWFFENYITKHTRMDWKIQRIKKTKDSVRIYLKNKSDRNLPLPLYLMYNDSIVERTWIPRFNGDTVITLSRKRANRIALNHERLIPEFSMRDNYKTLKKFAFNRAPEFRLFKDIEDPERSQVFLLPEFGFNVYDGLTLGAKFNNGTLLPKPFKYSLKPMYATGSKKIVGSASFSYNHFTDDDSESLYLIRYGISGNRFSYADDLMYRRASAFFSLGFRPKDLRSNKREFLTFRNVYVDRDRDAANPVNEPDYNVFVANYGMRDLNLKRFLRYNIGTEISPRFGKATFRARWRKLYKDSRQLDIRFFTGAFLYNDTKSDGDFFSFALDRPTDYLFDYNYYGRSEDSGLFSQQLIIAEGGFKSQLNTPFANQFISTVNTSYSIWKYIFVYADVGLVKNQNQPLTGVYDSGIRLNLLQDYFELYFPVYSSNGWEIGQGDYDERIRFIVTLDLRTLTGLFTRRWY